jgi:hypothetical protein
MSIATPHMIGKIATVSLENMIRLVRQDSTHVPIPSHIYASRRFQQYALFSKPLRLAAKTSTKATIRLIL